MIGAQRTTLFPYGGAMVLTALAVAVRWLLDPWLDDYLPLATLYGAVALAVWVGGYRPAILAVLLGYLACDWLFITPREQLGIESPRHIIGLATYLLSCSIIIGFGEAMRVARRHAEASREHAERERQWREEALRKLSASEQRFRIVSDLIPYGVWEADANGDATYLSPLFLGMTGQTLEEHRCGWKTLIHPDDVQPTAEDWQRCVQAGRPWEYEFRIRDTANQYRTILARGLPLRDETGQVLSSVGINYDITARRNAEDALRDSEQRFRAFMDRSPARAWLKDEEGRYLFVNRALLTGFGLTASDILGKTDADLFPAPLAEQYRQNDLAALHDGTVKEVTETSMEADGEHHFLSIKFPFQDGHGRWYVGGIAVDLTRQKRIEDALRQSEERFRRAADAAAALVYDVDLVAAEQAEAYGIEHIIGSDGRDSSLSSAWWHRRIHPDDVPTHLTHLRHCLDDTTCETYAAAYRVQHSDGSWRDVEDVARIVRAPDDGRPLRLVGTIVDRTERRRAEERLRSNNERLALLSGAAALLLHADNPDAMFRSLFTRIGPHLGLDAYFNYLVNERGDGLRLASYHGIPEEVASNIAHLAFGQGVCGTVAAQGSSMVAANIQQSSDAKVQLVRSFGIRAYACNPLTVEGKLFGTLSFASRSRDAFRDDELEFLQTITYYVAVAYERLRLIGQLREADRRKDEFLATLAHELRNPLAPIRNSVQILKVKGPPDAELRWARDVIDRQVQQMARLLDDLLDVSRIARNKLQLRKERIELAAVVAAALETSRPGIDASRHQLRVSLPPEPIWLQADPVRLAQVFANLLNNAAKYTDHGGQIVLSAERQGSDVVVSIRDNGIGITPDVLSRLFEIFSQAKPALERSQGGLGIGLSLVKGLVELHGGSIVGKSEGPGKGSEFIVRLPIAQDAPARVEPSGGDSEEPPLTRQRILVVDDNHDSADSLAMLLRVLGSEVGTVYDGEQAIEVAATFRPDLVLLDLGMPKLNGYDVCRRIRQEPWGKGMYLIAVTGWGQEEDRQRTRQAGFDHHLVKPVDPAALMKLLAGVDRDSS